MLIRRPQRDIARQVSTRTVQENSFAYGQAARPQFDQAGDTQT